MLRGLTVAVLAILLSSKSALPQQIPTTGTIEGAVVRPDTGEPVAGAQVTLTAGAAMAPLGRPPSIQPLTTGADGKFVFMDLEPGAYRVAANADGFVRQEYGQKALNGQGRPVIISAGQMLKNIGIRLIATGTVSGRVFDEDGHPATGAPIQILRPVYTVRGRELQQVAATVADDRGEYRAYGIPPGHYYLLAGTPTGDPRFALRGVSGAANNARFSLVYFPNAEEVDHASIVEVKSNSETAINMNVHRQARTYRVKGHIVDGLAGQLPAGPNIMLVFRLSNGSGILMINPVVDVRTGNFEFSNVPPGDYIVLAVIGNGPQAYGPDAEQSAQHPQPSAQTTIHVVDADVDGVALTLSTGITANGRVIVEEQSLVSIPNFDRIRLRFNFPVPMINQIAPAALPLSADGSFQVVGLREGEYSTEFDAPSGFYVKSIQYGGDEILGKLFHFSGQEAGSFEVVLHAGGVQVSGTLTDAHSQPIAGTPVFLVPSQRGRSDLYRQASTDQSGKFTMNRIPPGEYKLFSWEAADTGAQFDPEFLQRYEQQGKAIHISEGIPESADIRLILAP